MNFVRCKFRFADLDGDQRLELSEVLHLFKSITASRGSTTWLRSFRSSTEAELIELVQKMMLKKSLTS
jgi:hypothetical protein